MSIKAK